jgi:hypothetical protein
MRSSRLTSSECRQLMKRRPTIVDKPFRPDKKPLGHAGHAFGEMRPFRTLDGSLNSSEAY